jgi:hypothetical protein
VFVGAMYDRRPGAIEVAHSTETKQALVVILSRYSHGDPEIDWATFVLNRRTSNYLRVFSHKLAGHYKRPGAP